MPVSDEAELPESFQCPFCWLNEEVERECAFVTRCGGFPFGYRYRAQCSRCGAIGTPVQSARGAYKHWVRVVEAAQVGRAAMNAVETRIGVLL